MSGKVAKRLKREARLTGALYKKLKKEHGKKLVITNLKISRRQQRLAERKKIEQ